MGSSPLTVTVNVNVWPFEMGTSIEPTVGGGICTEIGALTG